MRKLRKHNKFKNIPKVLIYNYDLYELIIKENDNEDEEYKLYGLYEGLEITDNKYNILFKVYGNSVSEINNKIKKELIKLNLN